MRVLIVDDSVTMRRIESNLFAELGCTDIIQAVDGLDGLDKLGKNMPVDLVMLDINMPNMDGMATLGQIHQNTEYANVRVIMVTSEAEKSKVLDALRAGACDYIVKPIDSADFKMRLSDYLS
jgi:two-component system, chemotaxis family, chemotaxis protein CheY